MVGWVPESRGVQPAADLDRILLRTELITLGAFRCAVDDPRFCDSGPIRQHCFVFPRSAVTIEHEHQRPFVANANVVTFYNRGQRYLRGPISREGDRCDWFGIEAGLAREVLREFDPSAAERSDELFTLPCGRSDPAAYLAQRRIHARAARALPFDELALEEDVLALFERVLASAYARRPLTAPPARRSEPVHAAERILSATFEQDLRLGELARRIGVSVYHLSRSFRRETGTSLHQYRHQLRLRAGLGPLLQSPSALLEIALALGFSSHSHFTAAFRAQFGTTPSRVRAELEAPGPRARFPKEPRAQRR